MFLLDTNVLSELRKVRSGKADAHVAAWLRSAPAGNLFLSVIVIKELEVGVLLAGRRDRVKGLLLRSWLDDHVLSVFADRILPIDTDAAGRSAERPRPSAVPRRGDCRDGSGPWHGRGHVRRHRFRTDWGAGSRSLVRGRRFMKRGKIEVGMA